MFRILMFAGVALLTVMFFKRVLGANRPSHAALMEDARLGRRVPEPQCGVYVDNKEAVRRQAPDGELFFCSDTCADAHFEQARQGK